MIQTYTIGFSRYQQLEKELRYALYNTEKEEIKQWAKCTVLVFPKVTVRRVRNISGVISITAKGTVVEGKNFIKAGLERRLFSHAKQRTVDLSVFTLESYQNIRKLSKTIKKMLLENPKKMGIQMFLAVMGFNVGGGGIDAVEHNLLLWHFRYKQPPKAIIVEWPIYQRYIKHIDNQENMTPAGNWSDPEFVTYADIPLYLKGELTYGLLHRLMPTKIIDVSHGKISAYTWNSSMIWHDSIDKGTDGQHAGPKSHMKTAEQILSALGY